MAMRSDASEYHRLLDLVEDWLAGGLRRPARPRRHPQPMHRPDPPAEEAAPAAGPGEMPPPAAPAAPGAPPAAPAGGDSLEAVAAEVAACRRCGLHRERKIPVPGEGASHPEVVVVGEGPGADEDRTGRPFVGPAGRFLDRWLEAVELSRERNCFITNVVKCRPPGNRDPLPEETAACRPFLERQLRLLAPKAVLSLGRVASRALLERDSPIGSLRGRVHDLRGTPLVPTYHPSAVLRSEELKRPVWEDLKRLRGVLEGGPPHG